MHRMFLMVYYMSTINDRTDRGMLNGKPLHYHGNYILSLFHRRTWAKTYNL